MILFSVSASLWVLFDGNHSLTFDKFWVTPVKFSPHLCHGKDRHRCWWTSDWLRYQASFEVVLRSFCVVFKHLQTHPKIESTDRNTTWPSLLMLSINNINLQPCQTPGTLLDDGSLRVAAISFDLATRARHKQFSWCFNWKTFKVWNGWERITSEDKSSWALREGMSLGIKRCTRKIL